MQNEVNTRTVQLIVGDRCDKAYLKYKCRDHVVQMDKTSKTSRWNLWYQKLVGNCRDRKVEGNSRRTHFDVNGGVKNHIQCACASVFLERTYLNNTTKNILPLLFVILQNRNSKNLHTSFNPYGPSPQKHTWLRKLKLSGKIITSKCNHWFIATIINRSITNNPGT